MIFHPLNPLLLLNLAVSFFWGGGAENCLKWCDVMETFQTPSLSAFSETSLEKAAGESGQSGTNDCFQLSTKEATAMFGLNLAFKMAFS